MRIGDPIIYVDGAGSHTAFVGAVLEPGESRNKRLDVHLTDGRVFRDVPHEADAGGGAFWRTADAEPASEPEVVPEPEPPAPEPDPEPEPAPEPAKPTKRRRKK